MLNLALKKITLQLGDTTYSQQPNM